MGLLPIVLFILGIVAIGIAFKVESRLKPVKQTDPEVLAALRIIANLKRELSEIKKGSRELEFRVQDHELRILKGEISDAEMIVARRNTISSSGVESTIPKEKPLTYSPRDLKPESSNLSNPFLTKPSLDFTASSAQKSSASNLTMSSNSTQDKYSKAADLYNQKWEVPQIAAHLGLSQDAVQMVLKTSKRGGTQ